MLQRDFCSAQVQLSAAVNIFWLDFVRPLILVEGLRPDERTTVEKFGSALLGVSSSHKVLAALVSEGKLFPNALLDVLPSLRNAHLEYSKLLTFGCPVIDLLAHYNLSTSKQIVPELNGVDMSPVSLSLMPLQIIPKYSIMLKDALKVKSFDTLIVEKALKGVLSLCFDIERITKTARNLSRIEELNSLFGNILSPDDFIVDEALFFGSPQYTFAKRILLCDQRIVVLAFKDNIGCKLKAIFSYPLLSVRSVRNNISCGCLDVEVQEKEKVLMHFFSEDSLLLSQWVLALSLAIDQATNGVRS